MLPVVFHAEPLHSQNKPLQGTNSLQSGADFQTCFSTRKKLTNKKINIRLQHAFKGLCIRYDLY